MSSVRPSANFMTGLVSLIDEKAASWVRVPSVSVRRIGCVTPFGMFLCETMRARREELGLLGRASAPPAFARAESIGAADDETRQENQPANPWTQTLATSIAGRPRRPNASGTGLAGNGGNMCLI